MSSILGPHLLSIDSFTAETADALLRVAKQAEPIARREKVCRILEGAVLGNLFFEASTRTRMSFSAAFCRLGGSVCDTTGFTFSSMAKGESIYDTSRVISGYVDAMVVRHPEQGAVAKFAEATNIPVINGGDGPGEHPSQALLDLYTLKNEFERIGKSLRGAHIAFVGDLKYGRTVHSLIKLLSLYQEIKFTLIAPHDLALPSSLCDIIVHRGHDLEIRSCLRQPLHDIDVLYATRIQRERLTHESIEAYSPEFQVNASFLNTYCSPDILIMHPLPRDSSAHANDLSVDLDRDPRLAIFRQSDSGMAVRIAIFAILLGVDDRLSSSTRDATWRSPEYLGPHDVPFARLHLTRST